MKNSFLILLLVLFAALSVVACAPEANQVPFFGSDTSEVPDSEDSVANPATACDDNDSEDFYLCDAPWVFASTIPEGVGTGSWTYDPDFFMPGVSVPSIMIANDGSYRMFVNCDGTDDGSGTMKKCLLFSEDGLNWEGDDRILDASLFTSEPGWQTSDVSVVYLPDGTYRLIIVGVINSMLSVDADHSIQGTRIWSAVSTDGDHWTPESGERYVLPETDAGMAGVWDIIWSSKLEAYVAYYVGDWWDESWDCDSGNQGACDGDWNGVRMAISYDGKNFVPFQVENRTPNNHTDPCVMIQGGTGDLLLFAFNFVTPPGPSDEEKETEEGELEVFGPSGDWINFEGPGTPIVMNGFDDTFIDPEILSLPDGPVVYVGGPGGLYRFRRGQ